MTRITPLCFFWVNRRSLNESERGKCERSNKPTCQKNDSDTINLCSDEDKPVPNHGAKVKTEQVSTSLDPQLENYYEVTSNINEPTKRSSPSNRNVCNASPKRVRHTKNCPIDYRSNTSSLNGANVATDTYDTYHTPGTEEFGTTESKRWFQNSVNIDGEFHTSSNSSPVSSATSSSKRSVASRSVNHNDPSIFSRRNDSHTLESNQWHSYQDSVNIGGGSRNYSNLSPVSSATSSSKGKVASLPANHNATWNNPSIFSRSHDTNTLDGVMEHNQPCSNRKIFDILGRNSHNISSPVSSISSMRKLKELNPSHSLRIAPMSLYKKIDHYAFPTQMASQTKGKPPYVLVDVQPSPFTGDQTSANIEMQFAKLWMSQYEDMKKKASTPFGTLCARTT